MSAAYREVGIMAVIFILTLASVLGANDPGHDTLYVEEQGNSALNGSLNISFDLQVANRLFSTYLDIIGNGTIGGSANRILGTATDLYIESPGGDIIFNGLVGTSNMIRLGDSSGDNVNLNVTGNIYVDTGGDVLVDGVSVCLADGTNCQAVGGASSAGGWTNNSQNTTTTLNVGIRTTAPNSTLHIVSDDTGGALRIDNSTSTNFIVNTSKGRVGINTPNPVHTLQVVGATSPQFSITDSSVVSAETFKLGWDSTGNIASMTANAGGEDPEFKIQPASSVQFQFDIDNGTVIPTLAIDDNAQIGVRTLYPNNTLHVVGTANVSGNFYAGTVYSGGNEVCTASNGLCGSSAGGNLTGDSGTANTIPIWTNSTNLGASILSQDGNNDLLIAGNINFTTNYFTIGRGARGSGLDYIAIGENAQANNNYAVAIGSDAIAGNTEAVAIGDNANAGSQGSIAIGLNAGATNTQSISIGENSDATGQDATAIGELAQATNQQAIAIGYSADATGQFSTAIGINAQAPNQDGIAIGQSSNAAQNNGIAIGEGATATDVQSMAIGTNSNTVQDDGIAIGTSAQADEINSIAIGENAHSDNTESIALGYNANTTTTNQLMIGASTDVLNTHIYGTLNTTGNIYENNVRVCTASNGLCAGASADGTGGWTNTSTYTSTSLSVNVSNATHSLFYVDTTTGNTGIGTQYPNILLTVNRSQSASTTMGISNQNTGINALAIITATSSDGSASMYAAGSAYTGGGVLPHLADSAIFQAGSGLSSGLQLIAVDASGPIKMYTGGALAANERLRIDSTGNVGIGTTTPNSTLEIINTNLAGALRIQNGTHTSLFVNTTYGYVAIGRDTASYPLHVQGATVMLTNTDSINVGQMEIGYDTLSIFNRRDNILGLGTGSVQNQMVIGLGGYIGINTTEPNSTLHVIGTGNFTENLYEGSGRVCTASNGLCSSAGANSAGGWTNTTTLISSNSNVNVSVDGALFVDTANERVGIGTSLPNETLVVDGESRMIGNQTWEIPGSESQVCFERFVGTSQNYTRCINASGQVIETLGIFPVN